MGNKDIYAMTKQPGEDGIETFRLEVFKKNGRPGPTDVAVVLLRIAEDVLTTNAVDELNAREVLREFLDSDYKIEKANIQDFKGKTQ